MKKHLNILYIMTQGAYLAKEGQTVVVRVENQNRLQIPVHMLQGIVCFGRVSMSPFLMHFCGENHIGVSFLSEHGRFLSAVRGPTSGNVLLRRAQYRWADNEAKSIAIARRMVSAKLINSRLAVMQTLRDHSEKTDATALKETSRLLRRIIDQVEKENSLERIRGLEGEAARHYFATFDHMITNQKTHFQFKGRNRRPPLDPVNALLSFFYTLLAHDVRSALETVGLDPFVGFLHGLRPGRPALALDVMEELRSFLVDRFVLALINRRQVSTDDFSTSESGAVNMSEDARKKILAAWQDKKQSETRHPFLDEKMKIGLIAYVQAQLLARFIRGDLDDYPPFVKTGINR